MRDDEEAEPFADLFRGLAKATYRCDSCNQTGTELHSVDFDTVIVDYSDASVKTSMESAALHAASKQCPACAIPCRIDNDWQRLPSILIVSTSIGSRRLNKMPEPSVSVGHQRYTLSGVVFASGNHVHSISQCFRSGHGTARHR